MAPQERRDCREKGEAPKGKHGDKLRSIRINPNGLDQGHQVGMERSG